MDLFNISYADFERFLFVLFRVGAFIIFVPFLGSSQFPARLKVALILLIAVSVYPLVPPAAIPHPKGLLGLSVILFSEMLIGFSIAYVIRMIFTAVQIAGTMVDFQMGFGVVNVIDPQTQSQVSITAQFQNIFAMFLFLLFNGHHLTIHALVESFEMINPDKFAFTASTAEFMLQVFAATFVVAIKIGAPIMAILFFISVGLGLVARTVPQMNVFIVAFPLQIGVGLLMVGLTFSFFAALFKHQLTELPFWVMGLLHTF